MPIVADGALPNEIYIGKDLDAPLYTYTNNELSIGSIKGTFNCDIISNELPIDTFTFGVYYDENQDKVYLTNDTRQAYVCKVSEDDPAPVVPGTLESCGWAWADNVLQNRLTTITDNNVVMDSIGTNPTRMGFQPPASLRENRKFLVGDTVKIVIKVTNVTSKLAITFGAGNTVSSEKGLFVYDDQSAYGQYYTTVPGDDVLTVTYVRDTASMLFVSPVGERSEYEIPSVTFNGEMLYGRESTWMIYVLSRRGNVPAKRYLKDIKYGTPVFWFCNGNLQGKGYLKTVERTGTNTWKLTSMSAIGLLDEKIHPGGYYTGQTFDEVVQEIVGDSFPYEYAPGNESIAELAVFGWLPYDSARNNLHRLLFAMGAVLKRVDNQGG